MTKAEKEDQTYAKIVAHIAEKMYPQTQRITLMEDNLSSHKLATLHEIYEPDRASSIIKRLEIIRTPKPGS